MVNDEKKSKDCPLVIPLMEIVEIDSLVPPQAAIIADQQDIEDAKTRFAFTQYNEKVCELKDLDKKKAKALTSKLRLCSSIGLGDFKRSYQRDKIEKAGSYLRLYTDLSDDIELFEMEYGQTGRVVYFYLTQSSTIEIVSILKKHT